MKNKKKILWITGATVLTLFFILPAVIFSIINWGILPPPKLTPIVTAEINKRIQGEFQCEKVELTFFNTYPHLGIRLNNGELLSGVVEEADSLLRFNELTLTVRPIDYLTKGILTIGDIRMDQPVFYGYLSPDGKANWDILPDAAEKPETSEDSFAIPPIDLQRVYITDGTFTYDDQQSELYTRIDGFFLNLTGSLIQGGNTLEVETESKSIRFESPDYTLNNEMALHFKSGIELTDNFQTINLRAAEMRINNLPFTADGAFSYFPEVKTLAINVEMGLQASDLNELIRFVPEAYLKNKKDIKATGSVRLEANIHGELSDSILPTLQATCQLENGSYYMKGIDQGIDSLDLEMNIYFDGTEPNQSFALLEHLSISGMNTSMRMSGKVTNLLQSPAIEASLNGKVDLTRMAKEFLDADTLLLQGFMDADIRASFKLDDVMEGRYNNVRALGHLSIDSLKALSHPYEIDMYVNGARFSMDSAKVSSTYIAGNDLLNGILTVDSMHIKYQQDINTSLRGMEITAKTSPLVDTTSVMSVTSHIRVEQLRTRLPDSVWVVAQNAYLRGGIKPSQSNKQIPQIGASITVDSLRYFDVPARMGAMFAGSTFNLEALPFRDAMRQRFQQTSRDTTRQMTAANRTARQRGNRSTPSRNDSLSSQARLLQNWEVRGSVLFEQMRLFSRMFPLPMRMEKTKVKFDTNNIHFSDARFHAGKSHFVLNGEISSMRRAMLRGGKLQGKFSVSSDYIDCTELIQAASRGMLFAEQQTQTTSIPDNENLVLMDANTLQDSIVTSVPDSADMLFIVSASLDISLLMNANRIDYKDLQLEEVAGEIVLRNQSINLKKLAMRSNIGDGNVTMYYTAKDKEKASVGFDLEMQAIQVDKLIDLYPAIDTLLPMLRSFEGIMDCQMAATCDLDSASSVVLTSLNTGCSLAGKDMVLLDGETFAEISKTLMFKNKQRNKIDQISVDLAIRDNKIEVFPFLLEMDRYRVAVGGTHNLDMTFNYHVSVLKSPVPFKLGIDVTGNMDDFKYKIVKCKYKDIFQPAKQQELDPTPHNIRDGLRAFIRQQIGENAPELAGTENL